MKIKELLLQEFNLFDSDDELRQLLGPDGESECFLSGVKLGMFLTQCGVLKRRSEETQVFEHIKRVYESLCRHETLEEALNNYFGQQEHPEPF